MLIKNHFNEEVDVERLKRIKNPINNIFYLWIKVRLSNGQGEYWNYEDFNTYNPDFNWSSVE